MSKTSTESQSVTEAESIEIDLRDPYLAGFLAWLVPGAGHIYQRRYGKGILFFVCILGTFLYGLWLGGGRVVYASWTPQDRRWPYPCQLGAGAVTLPAVVQNYRVRHSNPPKEPLWGGFMKPPTMPELDAWQGELATYFDLGTTYTMVAGLLNVLAIYDALAGPLIIVPHRRKEEDEEKRRKKKARAGPDPSNGEPNDVAADAAKGGAG